MTIVALVILIHIFGCVAIERHNAMISGNATIRCLEDRVKHLDQEVFRSRENQRQLVMHVDALHAELHSLAKPQKLDFRIDISPIVEFDDVIISVDFGERRLRLARAELRPAMLTAIADHMANNCAVEVRKRFLAVAGTFSASSQQGYMSPDKLTRLGSRWFQR